METTHIFPIKKTDINKFVDNMFETVIEDTSSKNTVQPIRDLIVKNVREYVRGLEESPEMEEFKQRIKKELYTNIVKNTLDNDVKIDISELPKKSNINSTEIIVSRVDMKNKFENLVKMFEEFAKNLHKTSKNHRTEESFTYLEKKDSKSKKSIADKKEADENELNSLYKFVENRIIWDVIERKNVAEQTDIIKKNSFGCQVSLPQLMLSNMMPEANNNQNENENIQTTDTINLSSSFVIDMSDLFETVRESSSPIRELYSIDSDLTLTKLSTSHSDGLTDQCLTIMPCEQEFHTIHIEAVSSPASSVLRRPPLCTRLWHVVTDFCIAACFCIQVNKDCIFCMAFFVAFVVSTSFMTAFFYRTLTADSRVPHQHLMKHMDLGAPHINSINTIS